MKKLQKYLMLGFFTLFLGSISAELNECGCGSFSNGLTTYTVNGDHCCHSPTVGDGHVSYWVQNDGAWVFDSMEFVSGGDARGNCCPL